MTDSDSQATCFFPVPLPSNYEVSTLRKFSPRIVVLEPTKLSHSDLADPAAVVVRWAADLKRHGYRPLRDCIGIAARIHPLACAVLVTAAASLADSFGFRVAHYDPSDDYGGPGWTHSRFPIPDAAEGSLCGGGAQIGGCAGA